MRKFFRILLLVIIGLSILYLLGPKPVTPSYTDTLPAMPSGAPALEQFVQANESVHRLKPNNEARIVWHNDTLRQPTEYAIVYLHGFSASQEEGNPTHRDIARQFGANLYLARLYDHGIDTSDALVNYSPEGLWESAKQAYAIGKQLGKKVILMGTSTGGSVALQLAATYPDIAGLVLISPNIAINDPNAWMLNNPWGKEIARLVIGSKYRTVTDNRPIYQQYWNYTYRIEAIVALQEYLETAMVPATFNKVRQPVLTLAYYKNEQEQDPVVKISAMRDMFAAFGTPEDRKRFVEMAGTGDHVQGSPIKSKDVEGVKKTIADFLQTVMQIAPADSTVSNPVSPS
jgi:pimeloyl-ACP methyl ester carboxylesterase